MTKAQSMQRIGVFGGTFDPVHLAHIELAKQVIEQGQLSTLIIVPCSQSPHKERSAMATDDQRLQMLRLASERLNKVDICKYEINKAGVSYTVETLEYLASLHPAAELVFCLGEDSLKSFTCWRRWQDILAMSHLAVMKRDELSGSTSENVSSEDVFADRKVGSVNEIQKGAGQILEIESPKMPISATLIRERIKLCARDLKQPFEQDSVLSTWLDPRVLEYIVENKVYQ